MRVVLLVTFYFCMSFFLSGRVSAQSDAYAEQYYTADDFIFNKEYEKALPIWKDIEKNDPNNANIKFKIGFCYLNMTDKSLAIPYLEKAILKISPDYVGDVDEKNAPIFALYYLGQAYHANEKIDEAIASFNKFKGYLTKRNADVKEQVDRDLGECYNAKKYMKYPVDILVTNLGPSINTAAPEYSPAVSSDGNTLIFTSRRKGSTGNLLDEHMKYYEDIYISTRNADNTWTEAQKISPNINTNGHEASLSLSHDGTQLFIFKSVGNDGNIYVSKKTGNDWSKPEDLGPEINSKKLESHACLSPDGNTLYFSSNRRGSVGGKDIFYSKKQADGSWGSPVNIGLPINTPFDEDCPFMLADGVTLYFSSQGLDGMGGFDIYTSTLTSDGFWSTPKNLGYPINTVNDDVFYCPTQDGSIAYFSSAREGGQGDQDIYKINIIKPKEEFAVIKGNITDPVSFKPIDARLEIKNTQTNETVALVHSEDSTGTYNVALPANQQYSVAISSDGHQAKTETITIDESQKGKEITKSVKLVPDGVTPTETETGTNTSVTSIDPSLAGSKSTTAKKTVTAPVPPAYSEGEKFVMDNIYFDYAKSSLRDESTNELVRLAAFLNKEKNITVEISGHTDNTGSAAVNQSLSEKRAKSVCDYLIKNGIPAKRIKYKGYGFEQPLATNTTAEGRQANRRTEVRILSTSGAVISESRAKQILASDVVSSGDQETVPTATANGSLYTVQFTAINTQKPLNSPDFKGLKDIKHHFQNNVHKYTTGSAQRKEDLASLLIEVKSLGFKDAFITRMINDGATVAVTNRSQSGNYIYKVQLTALNTKKPLTAPDFEGLSGVVILSENNVHRYYIGNETNLQDATKLLEKAKAKGFDDAFIIKSPK